MEKKAVCIINAYAQSEGPSFFYSRMKEELSKFGVSLILHKSGALLAYLTSNGDLKTVLEDPAFILYLDKDLYLSTILEKAGCRLFNCAHSIALCDDKMLTHIALSGHGIRMPKTVSGPLNYSGLPDFSFLNQVERTVGYPLVMKSNFGSLGKEVRLINNRRELEDNERKLFSSPRLYQEFISSSFGFDYRVILVGGKAVAAMKRINESGDFRSNLAVGGRGEQVVLPDEYRETAEKAAEILGLDYAGVDLLEGKNKEPVLCEVNSNAFLKGIERVSGINVAEIYARYIVGKVFEDTRAL